MRHKQRVRSLAVQSRPVTPYAHAIPSAISVSQCSYWSWTLTLDTFFRRLSIAESFFRDNVIDLGSSGELIGLPFGYTLVADGTGGFGFDLAVGGAVPELSTWAVMLLGFTGLGCAKYLRARGPSAA